MKEGWQIVTLDEIFNDDELEDLRMMVNNNDWKLLKKYLNDKKEMLLAKNFVADYIYYYLRYSLEGKKF